MLDSQKTKGIGILQKNAESPFNFSCAIPANYFDKISVEVLSDNTLRLKGLFEEKTFKLSRLNGKALLENDDMVIEIPLSSSLELRDPVTLLIIGGVFVVTYSVVWCTANVTTLRSDCMSIYNSCQSTCTGHCSYHFDAGYCSGSCNVKCER